jgi:hypothetical protein
MSVSRKKGLMTSTSGRYAASRRQVSLDRDVFYFENDRREEVVTYKPFAIGGASVKKFGLTQKEESVYKSSLANLCSQGPML